MGGPFIVVARPVGPWRAGLRRTQCLACLLLLSALAGCSFVPRSKLDEAHRITVTLRAENTRLRDVALDLRAQNQDLTQRAVDDARKIAAQDEALARLEKSVTAYQAERDKLATAFETLKRQVRVSASPQPATALGGRLEALATAHPGWTFEPRTGAILLPADRLFEPGSSRLQTDARGDIDALAQALKDMLANRQTLEVSGRTGPSGDVQKTNFEQGTDGAEATSKGRFLATSRAARLREALVKAASLDPAHVKLTPPREGSSPATDARVELYLVPQTGSLDAVQPVDK